MRRNRRPIPLVMLTLLLAPAGCSKRPPDQTATRSPVAGAKTAPTSEQPTAAPADLTETAAELPDEAAGRAAPLPPAAESVLQAARFGARVVRFGDEGAGGRRLGGGRLDAEATTSVGSPQTGRLEGGVHLPVATDPHLRALARTARSDTLWGTPELVTLLRDAAAAVAREHGGVPLTVGNLSRRGGGDISASVSHNSGRDADLAFYLLDAEGKSVRWHTMLHCDDHGVVQRPAEARGFRFDAARNWALVRHLLSHPAVVVQWVFVAAPLRNMLLDHALRAGAPASMRERARRVLVQPSDSSRHDDHFHVRIACPPGDRPACKSGPGRTRYAREAQIDALLHMYHRGSPAERRYAREILSLPVDGSDLTLPPVEAGDGEHGEHDDGAGGSAAHEPRGAP